MIIGDNFIIPHLGRTGGTFLSKVVRRLYRNNLILDTGTYDRAYSSFPFMKNDWQHIFKDHAIDYLEKENKNLVQLHVALKHIHLGFIRPEFLENKRIFLFLRSPFSWWESAYSTHMTYDPKNCDPDINTYIKNMIDNDLYDLMLHFKSVTSNLKIIKYAYILKYEYLYSNIIHLFDDIERPLSPEEIRILIDMPVENNRLCTSVDTVINKDEAKLILEKTDPWILNFYSNESRNQSRSFMAR